MNSILLGMIAGVALALLNFLASGFYSSRVVSRSPNDLCCPCR